MKLSILVSAIDKFTAPARKMAKVGETMAASLHDNQKALNDLGKKGQAIGRMKALETRLGKTAAEMNTARARTSQLGRALAATTNPARKLQRDFEGARRKSDQLKRGHKQQRDELRQLRTQLRGAGIDTRKLGDAQRKVAKDIKATTKKMERMAKVSAKMDQNKDRYDKQLRNAANMTFIGDAMGRFGRGTLGLLSQPIAQMRMTERSKGELASLGIEKTGIETITKRGRDMTTKLAGITTADFVSAAYDIKSGISSLSDEGVADMTEMAALTAKATKSSVGQMTSLFATGYGSFKKSLYADTSDQDFGHILSASLAKSVEQFKTDGSTMQQAIQSMGSGLAESGISLADQFTALGMLQQKMEAGVAGTTMAALERSAGQAHQRFADMGLAIETLDENGNLRDLPSLLEDMQREFGDAYTTETGTMIQKAFGSEEAVKFFKALWGEQEVFRANAKALKEAQHQGKAFTRTMADAMDANMDARLQILTQRWDLLKEKLGYALIPALEFLIPWLEKAANWITKLADNNSFVTTAIMGLVGGVGLLAFATAPVITAIAALTGAIAMLGHASRKSALQTSMAGIAGGGRGGRGWLRKAGRFGKGLGIVSGLIGVGSMVATAMDDDLSGKEKATELTKQGGGVAGAVSGAIAGAAIGSVIPVVGTAIGGLVGSIAGGLGGEWLGGKIAGFFNKEKDSPIDRLDQAVNPVSRIENSSPQLAEQLSRTQPLAHTKTENTAATPISQQVTIHVQTTPGMDEQTLAEKVQRAFEIQSRAALYDVAP
ncbi:MAG: phage tail tape measure protein [Pseudomonadota bacterium]